MKVRISLPMKKGFPGVSVEFASQETAELGMAVYTGRLSIPAYVAAMQKREERLRRS
jgi:hypothetical protein